MHTPLRINEALLITDRAFKPFQCVAWTLPKETVKSASPSSTATRPVC